VGARSRIQGTDGKCREVCQALDSQSTAFIRDIGASNADCKFAWLKRTREIKRAIGTTKKDTRQRCLLSKRNT